MSKFTWPAALVAALALTACAGNGGESTEGLLLESSGRIDRDDQPADACAYWRNIRESEVQSETAMGPLPGLEDGARSRILRQRALRDCPAGAPEEAEDAEKDQEETAEPPA